MALSVRSLKIRDQILLVTLPPLFVLLCAAGLVFYAYLSASNTEQNALRSQERITQSETLLRNLTEMYMGVREYLFTPQPALLVPYEAAAGKVAEDISRLRELEGANPPQAQEVEAIQREISSLQALWAVPVLDKLKRGEALNTLAALREGQTRMASLRDRVLKLLEGDNARSLAEISNARYVMHRMLLFGVSLAVLLAAVLVFLTRVITRLIAGPALQLIHAAEQVSRGDFQPTLPPPVDNEFGVLSRSFFHMTTAIRKEREEMDALNKFSEAVTQCTSEQEVYDHLLHWLKQRFEPRQVIIFHLNPAENFLEAAVTLVPLSEGLRAWPVIEEPHNCKAVRSGRPFRVNDVTNEPVCPSRFALPAEGSYYCGPLIAGGIIIGAVRLEGMKGFWTVERERLLESYLSGAASALSNLRLLNTMKQQANVDVLTGLYNRRFLEDYARKLLAMARRRQQPVAIIMMDLDHFKSFNDIYGHELGDRILRQFAKTVTEAMREANLAARFGGEEFVVLLPDTGPKASLLVAERIRQAVMRMVVPSGTEKPLPQITVSLGIALFPEHGESLEEVLLASDKALYESKNSGRNRATVFAPQTEAAS
jgi:diguanylate cyclase (GGDEF)-like protein